MAYNGYLVKINGTNLSEKYIAFDSYQVTLSTSDFDSYRDADGILHRNALDHKIAKVEFNTPYIKQSSLNTLMSLIRGAYTNATEKKIGNISVYIPETDSYESTNAMYVPDITFKIYQKLPNGEFLYEPVRIAFIGY